MIYFLSSILTSKNLPALRNFRHNFSTPSDFCKRSSLFNHLSSFVTYLSNFLWNCSLNISIFFNGSFCWGEQKESSSNSRLSEIFAINFFRALLLFKNPCKALNSGSYIFYNFTPGLLGYNGTTVGTVARGLVFRSSNCHYFYFTLASKGTVFVWLKCFNKKFNFYKKWLRKMGNGGGSAVAYSTGHPEFKSRHVHSMALFCRLLVKKVKNKGS